jgi:hypothetical protein
MSGAKKFMILQDNEVLIRRMMKTLDAFIDGKSLQDALQECA